MNPNQRTRIPACAALAVALFSAFFSGCSSGGLVTVRSEVDARYAAGRNESGVAAETFVFSKGRMMPGESTQLPEMEFPAITKVLAPDLARSGYIVANDSREADLVIVVHWGMTARAEIAADMVAYDPDAIRQAQEAVSEARARANANAGSVNALQLSGAVTAAEAQLRAEATHAATLYQGNDLHSGENADLLGFRDVLRADRKAMRSSGAGEMLNDMANEERYFVVLVAYDAKAARTGQRRRVWTTRMSISAAGEGFKEGLDQMSNTAAMSHGRPQVGILITPPIPRNAVTPRAVAPVVPAKESAVLTPLPAPTR